MNKFIERIALAKLDGSMIKVINHIQRNDLVIFDDFGLQPLDNNSRLALLQILEDCYQRKSVLVTSQLPVSKWYDYINEPTLADAIMDRLLANNAHRIELKGDSLRRKNKNNNTFVEPHRNHFCGGTFHCDTYGTFQSDTSGIFIPILALKGDSMKKNINTFEILTKVAEYQPEYVVRGQ